MERDYITRIQKQYESYYKEVLSTQMWTLGIMGFILTAVFGLAGKFSIGMFDHRIKSALDAALAQVEKKFSEQMQVELQILQKQNAAQLKTLEDALTEKIREQQKDLKTLSNFNLQFSQGLSFLTAESYEGARRHFSYALTIYAASKSRKVVPVATGQRTASNLFFAIRAMNAANFEKEATEELAKDLYKDLHEELNFAATEVKELAPLLPRD